MLEQSLHSLFDLTGKVAVVTGASRGLGFQIARALGEYGCSLALIARNPDDLDEAVNLMRQNGVEAHAFSANLADEKQSSDLTEAVIKRFGRIDILINNAGTTWGSDAENFPRQGWEKVIDLNVTAMFFLTQAVAKIAFIPQGGGSVVNVASILGLVGTPHWQTGTVAYNTAKGAVISMTRALAAEWGPKSIRVNAIAPGYFPTKMTSAALAEEGQRIIDTTPLGKLGGTNDMMGPALLLASGAGGHMTGQVLVVDGGYTII